MKKTYKISLVAGATMMVMGFAGSAMAFHGGGVAHCDGCHSMHNSATDNQRSGSATAADLMKGSDASSTCLNCHNGTAGSYHIATPNGGTMSQGGDFFWIKTDYSYSNGRSVVTSVGQSHGHNIVAADFGFAADSVNVTAPGGTMQANTLGCTSCHDPHGQVNGGTAAGTAAISVSGSYGAAAPADGSIRGNYRLLGDDGFKLITSAAPVARANGSSGIRVQYGTGMSSWCLSCHSGFNDNANMHPTNVPVPMSTYNAYKKSGDFTGLIATAFDELVPFERGATDTSALPDVSTAAYTVGAEDANDVVMCLTCHRAHGSAFENGLRWDDSTEFIAESGILNAGGTAVTIMAAGAKPYYENGVLVDIAVKYGEHQRSLCNKCHAKD
ncbi:MAG: cytochrome C [Deltaproteobacteria bacterium]|nr:cytochrome C [Deltaproteobacteria bacterium]